MNKAFRDKVARSGTIVLIIGVVLLGIAFVSAARFLSEALPVLHSENSAIMLGETLAPLTTTASRTLYLAVMVWIGSVVTNRGVTLITGTSKIEAEKPQKSQVLKPTKSRAQQSEEQIEQQQERQEDSKPEPKTFEPELVIIPPEEMEQQSGQSQL